MPKHYPIYNQDQPPEHGMYLGLFHGRETTTKDMSDWGTNGPIIGPLNWCHTTYQFNIRIQFARDSDHLKYGFSNKEPEIQTDPKTGLVQFDGVYYGDWTVFYFRG